jgi:hypothetical protein
VGRIHCGLGDSQPSETRATYARAELSYCVASRSRSLSDIRRCLVAGQGQQFCREKANTAALFAEGKVTDPFDPMKTAAAESITGFLSEVTSFFISDVERRHAGLLTTSASTYLYPHADDAREVVDVFVLPTS